MHYPPSAFLEKAPKNRGWRAGAGQTSGSLFPLPRYRLFLSSPNKVFGKKRIAPDPYPIPSKARRVLPALPLYAAYNYWLNHSRHFDWRKGGDSPLSEGAIYLNLSES
jgi:hypothetical protein